jgi:hypothetical protein
MSIGVFRMSQMEKFPCVKCQKTVRQVPNDSIEGWLCQKCADKFFEKFGPCNICDCIITGPKFYQTQYDLKKKDPESFGEPDKEDKNVLICTQCIKEGISICEEDGFFHATESIRDYTDDEGSKKRVCLECFEDLVNGSEELELVGENELDPNDDLDAAAEEEFDEHDIDREMEEEFETEK